MLLCQYTTHQGFSRRFLLLPKIQQRALTFFWSLNASVIGHNGCRISVIGGQVARSNYKKVKGFPKWVLTFQACAEVSSRENQNLLTWQKNPVWALQAGLVRLFSIPSNALHQCTWRVALPMILPKRLIQSFVAPDMPLVRKRALRDDSPSKDQVWRSHLTVR